MRYVAGLTDDAENVVLSEQLIDCIVKFDFGSTILADKDDVADLDQEILGVTIVVLLTGSKRDYFGLLRLFFCGIGDNDPALDLLFVVLNGLDEDAITQWSDVRFTHFDSLCLIDIISAIEGSISLSRDKLKNHESGGQSFFSSSTTSKSASTTSSSTEESDPPLATVSSPEAPVVSSVAPSSVAAAS